MSSLNEFWNDLFSRGEDQGQGISIPMRLLRRHGKAFLLLPQQPRLAADALGLYPAQTTRARTARMLLSWFLRAGLPVGKETVSLKLLPEDPFVRFLAAMAGVSTAEVPALGVLAGNPASEGQRFLVLLFDARQRPVVVVKTGMTEPAKALIEKEGAFLATVSGKPTGMPGVRAEFQSPRLRALALDFFAGDSPRAREEGGIPPLLASWVDPQKRVVVGETADWTRLEATASANERFCRVATGLRDRTIQATIHHGDFTPWNIKVSPLGAWTVLDWERGELIGLPGWDWFHYVVQTGILVARLPTLQLIEKLEKLLDSEPFRRYAQCAAISGLERWLVLAYLLHCTEVIKPAEGLTATRDLLAALYGRWAGD